MANRAYQPDSDIDWEKEVNQYTSTHQTNSSIKYRANKGPSTPGATPNFYGQDGVYGAPPPRGGAPMAMSRGSPVPQGVPSRGSPQVGGPGIRVVPPGGGGSPGGYQPQQQYAYQNGAGQYGGPPTGYAPPQPVAPPPDNPPPPPTHQPRPPPAGVSNGSPEGSPSPAYRQNGHSPDTGDSPYVNGHAATVQARPSDYTGQQMSHPNAVRPNTSPMPPQMRMSQSTETVPNQTLSITHSKSTTERKESSQYEIGLNYLEQMEMYARNFLDLDELQSDVKEHMRSVIETFKEMKDALGTDADHDDREDIPALLDYEGLDWNMTNTKEVTVFRARASKVVHENFLYKDYHFPRYYSCSPLPQQQHVISCNVKLPAEMGGEGLESMVIQITEHDTAANLITAVFRKCESRSPDNSAHFQKEADYVLKALGSLEYMDGAERPLFEYDYIRYNLRHGNQIQLVLVPRPQIKAEEQYATSAIEYEALVEKDTPILLPDDFPWYPVMEKEWQEMEYIPMREIHWPYRVRILGIDNLSTEVYTQYEGTGMQICLKTILYYGDQLVNFSNWTTENIFGSRSARFMEWLDHSCLENGQEIHIDDLPRATRVGFFLFGNMGDDKDRLIAYVCCNLVDENGMVESGVKRMNMWPADERRSDPDNLNRWLFRTTTRAYEVINHGQPATLSVEWDKYALPVVAPLFEEIKVPDEQVVGPLIPWKFIDKKKKARLKEIWEKDPLYQLTQDDKETIWKYRHHLTKDSSILPKFLQSVDWMKPDCVHEAHRLLAQWVPPQAPGDFLELLDIKYHDYKVREYAVHFLKNIPDDELQLFLLQMTQILKFEPYHDSPLCRFLITRALSNPYQIGHHLFWHLKAEIHSPDFSERFGVIMEEYLYHVGRHVMELRKQASCVLKLQRVAEMVATQRNKYKVPEEEIERDYKRELDRLNGKFFENLNDAKFQMVLNPRVESTVLKLDKCRYMSSKKAPLWLVFDNADTDGPSNFVIFKSGDDLRQDILTLQLLKVMDKIWLSAGLDMRMLPYSCIATGVNSDGDGVGMIEVVLNSDTTSGIQLKYGGGAAGALKMTPLDDFLKDHNKGQMYQKAQENFVHSCAGYCVATFILGIGDRHNGNIMLTKDGHLFHIDFGHFLGNFKSKMGFNRERSAFVFTPEMAYVMGGKRYKKHPLFKLFKDQCCKAFNSLRKHGPLLINLFTLMISAGMPELLENEDVSYLQQKLYLDKSEREAEKIFKKEISNALTTTYRQLDNMIHNLKHK